MFLSLPKIELIAEFQTRVVLLCGRLVVLRPPLYVIPDEAFSWGRRHRDVELGGPLQPSGQPFSNRGYYSGLCQPLTQGSTKVTPARILITTAGVGAVSGQ